MADLVCRALDLEMSKSRPDGVARAPISRREQVDVEVVTDNLLWKEKAVYTAIVVWFERLDVLHIDSEGRIMLRSVPFLLFL